MITPLLLTPDELRAITGRANKHAQIAELKRRGWVFEINAAGNPVVARQYAEARLGVKLDDQHPAPDFSAIRQRVA